MGDVDDVDHERNVKGSPVLSRRWLSPWSSKDKHRHRSRNKLQPSKSVEMAHGQSKWFSPGGQNRVRGIFRTPTNTSLVDQHPLKDNALIRNSAQPSVQLGRGTPSVASEDNDRPSILSGIRRVVTVTKLFAEPPSSSDEENSPRLEADTPESSPTSSANSCASDGQSGGRNPLLQGIIAQKYAVQTLQLLQRFPDFAGKEEVRSLFEDIACFRGTVPKTP